MEASTPYLIVKLTAGTSKSINMARDKDKGLSHTHTHYATAFTEL